jgi:hypothetical protein
MEPAKEIKEEPKNTQNIEQNEKTAEAKDTQQEK